MSTSTLHSSAITLAEAVLAAKFDFVQSAEFIAAVQKCFEADDAISFDCCNMSGTFEVSKGKITVLATPFWDARCNSIPTDIVDDKGKEIAFSSDELEYDLTLNVEVDAQKYHDVVVDYINKIA